MGQTKAFESVLPQNLNAMVISPRRSKSQVQNWKTKKDAETAQHPLFLKFRKVYI